MAKNTLLLTASAAILGFTSCQNTQQQNENGEYKALAAQAIEVHDEIMPEVSRFDRTSLKIDSILNSLSVTEETDADPGTTGLRNDLKDLQANIDAATDFMMEWMREYEPDSTDVDYQKSEIERINRMKKQFDDVRTEINTKLKDFN